MTKTLEDIEQQGAQLQTALSSLLQEHTTLESILNYCSSQEQNAECMYIAGKITASKQDETKALEYYQKATGLEDHVQSWYEIVNIMIQRQRENPDSIEYTKWSLYKALESKNPEITQQVFQLGQKLHNETEYILAEIVFTEIVKQTPNHTETWRNLALTIKESPTNQEPGRQEYARYCEYKANGGK